MSSPGYLLADAAAGRRLTGFEVLWADPEHRDLHRFWAAEHPKRYLAGCVVVGTIDQILLSALAVPHQHLRGAPLLRHLLVVDEVHASDTYMSTILTVVLKRHLEAGGHALLLSATLGARAAADLLKPGGSQECPSLESAVSTPYPLLRRQSASTETFAVSPMRLKEAYKRIAEGFGIEWQGRRYDRKRPDAADPANRAINHVVTAVEACAAIACAVTGAIPQIGFVHEDSGISLILDIADLFRTEVTLPVAFAVVKESEKRPAEPVERVARRLAARTIKSQNLVPTMIDRIKELFECR